MIHKPFAPKLQVRIKTHKDQHSIRPVLNNINAPSYRTAKLLKRKLTEILQPRNMYNTPNSTQLAYDITTLKLNANHRCFTFDIRDFFTNIPIIETIYVTKHLLKHNNIMEASFFSFRFIMCSMCSVHFLFDTTSPDGMTSIKFGTTRTPCFLRRPIHLPVKWLPEQARTGNTKHNGAPTYIKCISS